MTYLFLSSSHYNLPDKHLFSRITAIFTNLLFKKEKILYITTDLVHWSSKRILLLPSSTADPELGAAPLIIIHRATHDTNENDIVMLLHYNINNNRTNKGTSKDKLTRTRVLKETTDKQVEHNEFRYKRLLLHYL